MPRRLVDTNLVFMLLFILLFWAFFVLNTELVIRWNQVTTDGSRLNWQFGQVCSTYIPWSWINFMILLGFTVILISSAFHQHD